jgi:hypothetical protein
MSAAYVIKAPTIPCTIVSLLAGALLGALAKNAKSFKAFKRAMKASLRRDLCDSYEKYCLKGEPLTIERKHEIVESFEAYAALGGNGTGKQMYEAICQVEITAI